MRFTYFALAWMVGQVNAQCGWKLEGNDCICMNSANGTAWSEYTKYCCSAMGVTPKGSVWLSCAQGSLMNCC